MKTLLYYDCINQFKRSYYKDLLNTEHITSGEIHINKMHYPNGTEDTEANFWGYSLEKDGVKYLLPVKDLHGNIIKLFETLPILVTESIKISNKNQAYLLIKKYNTARFKPVKTMTFKEIVDKMSSFEHTNNTHQKLLWFIAFASMFDRANFRVCTPAGFGKDSSVTILGNLIGGALSIVQPTIAKLEYRTHSKWLVVNEVNDIGTTEWNTVQQFLLDVGDHKPEVEKHSRAVMNGVKETLDISKLSITLFYNDINHYPNQDKYFDFVTRKAVLDRFPAFRLYGNITEDFNQIKDIDVSKFVTEHESDYKELVYGITYYKEFFNRELKHFKVENLRVMPQRWKTNIGRLLKIIDLYCETQEEFNYWIGVINASLTDYAKMIEFGKMYNELKNVHGKKKGFLELNALLSSVNTYKERLQILQNFDFTNRKVVADVKGDFWSTQ